LQLPHPVSRGVLAALTLVACLGDSISGPALIGDGTRMLFIGNSHLYVTDVPGILQALADSAGGERLAVETVANPDYAVIDHWLDGIAQREIAKGGWKYVVLQQGWTPAGVCRDTLRLATKLFSDDIKKVGATPALFETWGNQDRPVQFQGSIESYRLAAEDVGGLLFPIAEAWQEVWRTDATVSLYSDGLHANLAGSYLTALVIYARIFQKTPVGLPSRLRTRQGMTLDLDPVLGRVLQDAAATIGLAPTPVTVPTAPVVITSRC